MRKTYLFNLGLWALFVISSEQLHSQRGNFSVGVVPTYKTDGYGIQANVNYSRSTTDHLQVSLAAAFRSANYGYKAYPQTKSLHAGQDLSI